MSKPIIESEVEQVVLDILSELGYKVLYGPDIAPDGDSPERKDYSDVVLIERLKTAIDKFNPSIPVEATEEAVKKILRVEGPSLVVNNQLFHNVVVDGINVEYRRDDRIIGDKVWMFDFKNPENNEFLAVNQFTVIENNNNRRPDIVLFVNGLPLCVIELKNPADENATVKSAFDQFETYKAQIPSLFRFNEVLVISDGLEARAGTITSNWERFLPWKTIDGIEKAPTAIPQIEVLLRGMFDRHIFLDLVRHFVVFEKEQRFLSKKLAAYHQYHAVNKAIDATLKASEDELAFYDTLEVNDSAVKVLGDEVLRTIARELVNAVRNNITIDWTLKETVQAKLRVMVKRVLRKYGYPPDKQKKATETVLEQAALICKDWAEVN